jgi:uncharacterized protein
MSETANGNRLAQETSPYLLQHAENPVHWRAWGEEALAEAKQTSKPILLSVGYAACHWCHVMAHESFEDDETAKVMNELFVNIKVDREERPDVDAIYMAALHELGEQGGWPLTMFLTAEAEPFWGGTYFPKEQRYGRPAFVHVLREVSRIYRDEPEKVRQNANLLKERLAPRAPSALGLVPSDEALANLTPRLVQLVDPVRGGIRGAPKFPQASFFGLLWRAGLRYGLANPLDAVDLTLTHIAQGGIYDHIGGGFARYTVDDQWLVPHFEKMLYDNAQLIELITEVWRERRSPLYAQRVAETVDWLMREMVTEGGAFASSLDADSEGEEGKFYVWSADEIASVLGPEDAKRFAEIYDVTPEGNWEGKTILNRLNAIDLRAPETEARLAELRAKLLEQRTGRVRPGFDDKVLADWNGLMIAALARAGEAFSRDDWIAAAVRAFAFIAAKMSEGDRLYHAYRAGQAKAPAIANDYANMIRAALQLASVTGEDQYIDRARSWTEVLDRHYWSTEFGGYYFTADDTKDVIVRTLTAQDDATPNANGMMVSNLMALYLLTGETRYQARAETIVNAFASAVGENVFAHTGLLAGALDLLAPTHVVLIAAKGGDAQALRKAIRELSIPGAVVQESSGGDGIPEGSPVYGKTALNGRAAAYVCIGPQCSMPVTDGAALVETLKRARMRAAGVGAV